MTELELFNVNLRLNTDNIAFRQAMKEVVLFIQDKVNKLASNPDDLLESAALAFRMTLAIHTGNIMSLRDINILDPEEDNEGRIGL